MVAKALPWYGVRHTEIAELLVQGNERIRQKFRLQSPNPMFSLHPHMLHRSLFYRA